MIKHKFFERFLDNDLKDIEAYLDKKLDDILDGKVFEIDTTVNAQGAAGWYGESGPWTRFNGTATQMLSKYNLLKDDYEPFRKLHKALADMTVEACEYYGVDFEKQNYHVMAWFNYDYGVHKYDIADLHDHNHGKGSPHFHGYYCVDAEPSVTHYQIYKDPNNMVENVNKNNRAIVSETGHPHSRGDWNSERPRITIAYDILPFEGNTTDNFIKL